MKSAQPAIVLKNITKSFHQGGETLHVLKDVCFTADVGELVMIVGPSGSGKTTLLSVLAGTLRADSGDVNLFGTVLTKVADSLITKFRKENIGFIFQQFNLIPTLTCLENVSLPLILNKVATKEAEKRSMQALEEVGLGSKAHVVPKKLSGGQQQRVAIARALVHEPRLIICDEPTSSLDAETGVKVTEVIRGLARSRSCCVVVVTHDNRIFKYADRIVKMDDGKILTSDIEEHC
jgi:putative ABC transport system ATP-binding protein